MSRFTLSKANYRFAVITPTISRDVLRACVRSVVGQTFTNYKHFVVGDGPLEEWAEQFCYHNNCHVMSLPEKRGAWGAHARNMVLEYLDLTSDISVDYLVFLDDDNVLFPMALERLNLAAVANQNPPLMYQPIVHYRRWDNGWWVLPTEMPPKKSVWDTLNGCYRHDVVRGLRWNLEYEHDFHFAKSAIGKAGSDVFVKAHDDPGGLHL